MSRGFLPFLVEYYLGMHKRKLNPMAGERITGKQWTKQFLKVIQDQEFVFPQDKRKT